VSDNEIKNGSCNLLNRIRGYLHGLHTCHQCRNTRNKGEFRVVQWMRILNESFRKQGKRLGLLVPNLLKLPIAALVALFEWATDYDGFAALLVKPIPVLMMFCFVLFPWWSLPLWIMAGYTLGTPLCYVVLVLWLLVHGVCVVLGLTVQYWKEKT